MTVINNDNELCITIVILLIILMFSTSLCETYKLYKRKKKRIEHLSIDMGMNEHLLTNMGTSEHKIIKNNSENLIICFGGMALKMGGILPFEFLNYLSKTFQKNTDLYFYIDKNQCWYHKGIDGITNNIDDTVLYLNSIIKKSNYKKILFMGVSAGGYASILFGSLCNVSSVIAFIPRTKLDDAIDKKYQDLKTVINNQTKYVLHGDLEEIENKNHHILQCIHLDCFKNVRIIYDKGLDMRVLRDNGTIKKHIDNILINHL